MGRNGLLLFVWMLLTGCSAGSGTAIISPPASAINDEIVVPAAVLPAYTQLSAELQASNFEHFRLLDDSATATLQPMAERRALVYLNFKAMPQGGRHPSDLFEVWTLASPEGAYDSLIEKIAAQLDCEIVSETYATWNNPTDQGYYSTNFTLRSRRAMSVGEYAWMGDWIVSNYGDSIITTSQVSYIEFG